VKTLSDSAAASVNYAPTASSVAALRALPASAVGGSTPRIAGAEMTTYRIPVRLVSMKLEDDRDIHLVVADPATGQTMIVEFPNPACQGAINSPHVTEIASARGALISAVGVPGSSFINLSGSATVTGVGFFDVLHGQTGVAPNGIELHPALAFSFGTASATTTTTTGTATTTSPTTTTSGSTTTATPTPRVNHAPRIASVKFIETAHGKPGTSYSVTEEVRFKACDDGRGTLLAEITESKGVGEQLFAKGRRVKTVKLTAACGTSAVRWRLASRFLGVGSYVISLRVRDPHGVWSGARTHRSFTSD
jgi:hypothetical protein